MSVHVPRDVSAVEPAAGDSEALAALLRREQQIDAIQHTLGWRLLSYYGPYKQRFVRPMWRRMRQLLGRISRGAAADDSYEAWTRFAERFRDATSPVRAASTSTVSVIMTVDVATRSDLDAAVASLLAQSHAAWELRIAAVGNVTPVLAVTQDPRVVVDPQRYTNHADAMNAMLAVAQGDVVALCAAAAALAGDALQVAVDAFAATTGDVLYSDEDLRDDHGRRGEPQLKPAWSPDLLLSWMYWSRVVFYRRSFLARLLPLRSALEGAHLWDLALRATEHETRVVHVPRILAHVHGPPATAGTLTTKERDAGRRALEAALERRGIAGLVEWHAAGAVYRVRRAIGAPKKVSIIIPTRDGLAMLERCVRAVEATDYASYEIVIVDNGSVEPETLGYLATTPHRVVRAPGPFNFSRLNNVAVAACDGAYLLFLNNDTEPCDPGWLCALVEHAQRPEVGAVGAKLLYGDGRIQHAGIMVGIGGLAGHPHRFERYAPESIRDVSAVTGACLLMRRETFEAIGGFDERLPVNSNDVDLCLRLRERGYLVVYTPHAVLFHYESQTRGFRAAPDDAWLMTRRWREILSADPYGNPNVDLADERGVLDISKPDGMTCVYRGPRRADDVLEIEPGTSVGQRFYATAANLCAVVVRGTVRGPHGPRALRVSIRQSPAPASTVRAAARIVSGRVPNELWCCFEPIPDSADRFWYVAVEIAEGHHMALQRSPIVSDVMGPCFVNSAESHGTLAFELYARAPQRCTTSPP